MIRKIKNFVSNVTIRQKLTILLIVFVLYPVIIVSFFGYFKYAKDIRSEIINSLDQRIERLNDLTLERFEQTKRFAMMIPYDGILNDIYVRRKNGEVSEDGVYKDVTNYLYSKFYSKQEIKAVYFFFTDKSQVNYMVQPDSSYSKYMNTVHPIIVEKAEMMEKQFGYYISDDGEFYIIRKMFDRFTFKQYGLIIIKIDRDYMLAYFKDDFKNSSGMILTYDDRSIFEQGQIPQESRSDIMEQIRLGLSPDNDSSLFNLKHYEVISSSFTLDNVLLRYGVIMPTNLVMDRYYNAVRLLVALTLLVTIAMLLVALPLSKAIWSPIGELVGLMQLLEKGNLGVQSQRIKNDEFKFIFDSFNNMSNEIKYLFDVVYREELARKEAQLAALQARINPHFLYNTLEIMNWKARIGGNTELSEIIEALGRLLDAGMNRGGQSICRLKDEIKLVESYMLIMDKRLGKRLEYVKEIDENLLEGTIPKLLIQPLLENAMIHGVEPLGGGRVVLSVKLIEKRLVITVEDNGAGISDEDLEEFNKLFMGQPSKIGSSTGIGVKNVHERIQIIYGKEYGLHLKKGRERGTTAIITIPYIL